MSDNRAIAYIENGVRVFRASAIGMPLRCLVLALMEERPAPPPDYLVKAAAAGTAIEGVVKDELRSRGFIIAGEQNEVELNLSDQGIRMAGSNAIVRGHLDAIHCEVPDREGVHILEVKSMSPRVWDEWQKWGFQKFKTYAWQISIYMHATGRPAVYAIINRETEQVIVFYIDTPPVPLEEIEIKVAAALSMLTIDVAPVCDGTSPYPCAYDYLCDKREWEFAELEAGEDTTFLRLAEDLDAINEQIKELESKKEFNRALVRKAMGDRAKVEVPGWSFSVTKPEPKRSLDMAALQELLGEQLDKLWVETERDPILYIHKKKATKATKRGDA